VHYARSVYHIRCWRHAVYKLRSLALILRLWSSKKPLHWNSKQPCGGYNPSNCPAITLACHFQLRSGVCRPDANICRLKYNAAPRRLRGHSQKHSSRLRPLKAYGTALIRSRGLYVIPENGSLKPVFGILPVKVFDCSIACAEPVCINTRTYLYRNRTAVPYRASAAALRVYTKHHCSRAVLQAGRFREAFLDMLSYLACTENR